MKLSFFLIFCFIYKGSEQRKMYFDLFSFPHTYIYVRAYFTLLAEAPAILFNQMDVKSLLNSGALDLNVLRCFLQNKNICPSPYIMYRLYAP